jgi:hypothetical protein
MPNYRRFTVPGATVFFTVVTHERRRFLTDPLARRCLRVAFQVVRARHPFEIRRLCSFRITSTPSGCCPRATAPMRCDGGASKRNSPSDSYPKAARRVGARPLENSGRSAASGNADSGNTRSSRMPPRTAPPDERIPICRRVTKDLPEIRHGWRPSRRGDRGSSIRRFPRRPTPSGFRIDRIKGGRPHQVRPSQGVCPSAQTSAVPR